MEERRVVGGIERIGGVVPIRPLPLAVQDGVVQFKAFPLVVVKGPAEKVHCIGDVHEQVTEVDQDSESGQDCAK